MQQTLQQLSATGRAAAQKQDWATVQACAQRIVDGWSELAEGYFLQGLAHKGLQRPLKATQSFERALDIDPQRYDAAVELAGQYSISRRNADVARLLGEYAHMLGNSPLYLNMAGAVYTQVGLPEKGVALLEKANELQPGIDLFQANLATCYVFLGRIDEARELYRQLLERFPAHQRNHYEYARLQRATDSSHIDQMKELLRSLNLPPEKNVFLYYAIGKELEDLERWDEAFRFYKRGGDAVTKVANYDVARDIELIDTIIDRCSKDWLANTSESAAAERHGKTPIFVTGLPRTGTTLTERIVSSHSSVQPVGETLFMQMVIRRESGVQSTDKMNAAMIEAASTVDIGAIGNGYFDALSYRLDDSPLFVDKLPFNFLFLGFIARAWPDARMIVLRRHPLDSCFAMYKQVFTWAYKFSYSLPLLGRYYVAHERLYRHWQDVIGDRLITVRYEDLVTDQERETRKLLERLGLEFEPACLEFDRNPAASTTASSVQVREKVHTRSVARYRHIEKQLEPLRKQLEEAGIDVS